MAGGLAGPASPAEAVSIAWKRIYFLTVVGDRGKENAAAGAGASGFIDVLLVFITFYVTLVYLNAVIAQISETFDRMQEVRESNSFKARAELIREIAVYAEKTDIAEEITRLRGHLKQFEARITGNDGSPLGRTLEFLTQEMLREANTMASKSPSAEIAQRIVEIKGAIDRIKEQVLNIA